MLLPTNIHHIIPVAGCGKADLVYVLDSSASIGEKNLWVLKQFAIDVMKGVKIGPAETRIVKVGPEETRIAGVTYSDYATTHWALKG